MDGFELLKQDHDNVKRLCDELDEANTVEHRRQLFAEIEGEIKLHEECEEKVLYPTLRDHPKLKDIVLEGYQEHHVVDVILGELRNLIPSDETWPAKAKGSAVSSVSIASAMSVAASHAWPETRMPPMSIATRAVWVAP